MKKKKQRKLEQTRRYCDEDGRDKGRRRKGIMIMHKIIRKKRDDGDKEGNEEDTRKTTTRKKKWRVGCMGQKTKERYNDDAEDNYEQEKDDAEGN